jgi:hypothetical protein
MAEMAQAPRKCTVWAAEASASDRGTSEGMPMASSASIGKPPARTRMYPARGIKRRSA